MKPQIRFEDQEMRVADLGEESSIPDLSGEMILQNQLKFSLDEEDEICQGYGRRDNAYPYRKYDSYTRSLKRKMIRTAVLENQYLTAVFLPEYGGRLWPLTDKRTGRNLLYTNDVIRFSNLAVRNAWFSGGVEWNIGVIGHCPLTTDPLYTARTEDEYGNPVLRMYEFERIRKVSYQMDFWLLEDSPYLNCRMRIVNDNDDLVPMYWWSNMAVPEYVGGRIVVPASKAYTLRDFQVFKVQIPYVDSVDITDYRTIPKSVDYFFDIEDQDPKYIANLDKDGYGLVQMSTKRLRGRKLFSWGNQNASDRWQEFLTDQAGRYIEIQAGLGKTQYGCIPMPPHRAWEWMERYGAAQIAPSLMSETIKDGHGLRQKALTGQLCGAHAFEDMERFLKDTKAMAKKAGKLILSGSGYGAFCPYVDSLSSHLQFTITEPELKNWKRFLETGILACPSPQERPGVFFDDEISFELLQGTIQEENKENWYAHYLLGVRYYQRQSVHHARIQFKKSLELERNPWALHGLACLELWMGENKQRLRLDESERLGESGRTDESEGLRGSGRTDLPKYAVRQEYAVQAEHYIRQGMDMRRKDISYLKEGFKILFLCGAYDPLIHFYETLDETESSVSRLRFYYISAWYKLGYDKKAYEMLEADGGLELEDIREGEDSIMELWTKLHESLYGCRGEAPHKYRFHAFE